MGGGGLGSGGVSGKGAPEEEATQLAWAFSPKGRTLALQDSREVCPPKIGKGGQLGDSRSLKNRKAGKYFRTL